MRPLRPQPPLRAATCALGILLAGVAAAASPARSGADWDYYLTGDPADATPATRGGLVLAGGGGDVDEAMRWFLQRAGGGDIVVLRASGADGYHRYLFEDIGGCDSVETMVFRGRDAAADPFVLERLRRAEGVFVAGGDQARYVRWWRGTPVAETLNEHLRAGRPLGGTSAGLAILGQFYFSADFDPATAGGELDSRAALADPFDPRLTLGDRFLEAAPLCGVITDSHFTPRARLGRLLVFLARLRADRDLPAVRGIGIDEKTALLVDPDGAARVVTAASGGVTFVEWSSNSATLAPGRPLDAGPFLLQLADPTSTFSLATWSGANLRHSAVTVRSGELVLAAPPESPCLP